MFNEDKRGAGTEAYFEISLELRTKADDAILIEAVPGFLKNVSPVGAGLIVSRVFFDKYHLFYSPQDDPDQLLFLKARGADNEVVSIPVMPLCFTTDEDNPKMPYLMSVEFLLESNDKKVKALNRRMRVGRSNLPNGLSWQFLKNLLVERLPRCLVIGFQQ